MIVEKKRKNTYLVCRKCGLKRRIRGKKDLEIREKISEMKKEVIVIGKDEQKGELPKTKVICPKCGNKEAFWWVQQTRGADEPPTVFYKCTECGYSWRSYG